jgi:HK97 family phage portal protein
MKIGNLFRSKKPEMRSFEEQDCGEQDSDSCDGGAAEFPYRRYPFAMSDRLSLSTVYRCVDLISSSIAQLPVVPYHVYKGHKRIAYEQAAYMLLKTPNRRMTMFTFVKLLISQMLLKGNGYALIRRESDGRPAELVYIPNEYVTIVTPTTYFEDIKYQVVGIDGLVEHTDIIHLLNYTYDGYSGVSTIRYAADTLDLAAVSEQHARTFFHSGANISGVLTVNSPLSEKQTKDIKKAWAKTFNSNSQSGGVAVVPGNMDFKPVQINPKDAQLLESRRFNVLDIARFFGVPATKLNSKEGATYNGIEAEQIAFLTDTIQPVIEKVEAEFERKLFRAKDRPFIDVKFDVTNLLRVDIESKAEYYAKMFQLGVYSPNEMRQELGYEGIENGDSHFVQVNLMTLKQFGENKNIDFVTTNKANPGANNPA